MTTPQEQELALLEDLLYDTYEAPETVAMGEAIADPHKRVRFYLEAIDVLKAHRAAMQQEKEPPVGPRRFFTDPHYMGASVSLWPALFDEVCEACSGKYIEAVWTGAIGTGKTTGALAVLAYYLYRVMNLRSPHKTFDLDPNSEIVFVMQSVTGGTAFTVDYMRFRRMLESSPWFQLNAPHEKDRKATIQFHDSAVFVQPLPGTETAAIGENVFGGLIDEVNHMKVVQKSAKKRDGAAYDQMLENYRAISRRRESRFQRVGRVPGMLCLVGSANYAGQFTDRKKAERDRQLQSTGETSIYLFDKRPWEVQPEDRFSPQRFSVFLGDGSRKPRILKPGEAINPNDAPYVMAVPVDYRSQFESDLPGAIKDIAGMALQGFSNFIPNYAAIKAAFGTKRNLFTPDWCDFDTQGAVIPKHSIPLPKEPRYVHIDLALSMDNAAFCMGHVSGFKVVNRGGGVQDVFPQITIDGLLSIRPSGGSQIPIHKIKKLVFALQTLGYKIEWVSLDGFQSADFIQTMRRSGIRSGIVSLDRTPEPYMATKQLILDGCVHGPPSELACTELSELVWVSKDTKVDHPPDGSKDLADTIAGTCYGLATKRAVWVRWGVDPKKSTMVVKKGED